MQLARKNDPSRRNLDVFKVVHVIDDSVLGTSLAEVDQLREALSACATGCAFFYLSSIFDPPDPALLSLPLAVSPPAKTSRDSLLLLLQACKSASSRVDLKRILVSVLLVQIAQRLGCSKVYCGDSCSRLATNIMVDTCTGRGVSLPWKLSPAQHCRPYSKPGQRPAEMHRRLGCAAAAGNGRSRSAALPRPDQRPVPCPRDDTGRMPTDPPSQARLYLRADGPYAAGTHGSAVTRQSLSAAWMPTIRPR